MIQTSPILRSLRFTVDERFDLVDLRVRDALFRFPYAAGFEIEQALRQTAKVVFRAIGQDPAVWRDETPDDLEDQPAPARFARRSELIPNVRAWRVYIAGNLVGLEFDGVGYEIEPALALKLSHGIRRASRRAKAWAGDTTKHIRMSATLEDANATA